MGYREDEKRWKRLQDMLAAEASGRSMKPVVSQRTLFGIPSTVEQVIARTVAEDEEARRMKRKQGKSGDGAQRIDHPLEPIYDKRSRVLMLGSMPSPKSREIGFYYGHPQNRFWRVMAELFDEPTPSTNERRRDLLLRHHIALWDVLASCMIEGASDASIADAVPNDLSPILSNAPIEAVFCTGAKAAELYTRLVEPATGIPCAKLPSTSPANAVAKLEDLVDAYRQVLPHLHDFEPPALDVADVVALEKTIDANGTSLAELMDRAGGMLAHRVHALKPRGRIVVLCGNGNNGGDGWVAARLLAEADHKTTLVTTRTPDELKAQPARDAAIAVEPLLASNAARVLLNPTEAELSTSLEDADIIIDALLGTGFSGSTVKSPFDTWIELANKRKETGAKIVSADAPSGLDAQTGTASTPCVHADETVTMITSKTGLHTHNARNYTGRIRVVPLAYIEPYLDEG